MTLDLQLRKFAYTVKNSSTILLPKWFDVLQELELDERKMPQDVVTHWNSTFKMLDFALKYHKAIKILTSDDDLELEKYKLTRNEWMMVKHLRDVLKVSILFILFYF